jgi:hypothetical protein
MTIPWLPCLILFESCGGNWAQYVEVVYGHFKRDFVDSKPLFRGTRMGLKRYPMEQGKEATFWHLTSEGKVEADRLPDLRRCERICWPKLLIEKVPSDEVRVWLQRRKGEDRIAIAPSDFSYIVVLAERQGRNGVYHIPWTAFYVEFEHDRRNYEKEWTRNGIKG